MPAFTLKPGMLLGVASAATQIEGGDKNNSWYEWYEKGHIKDGSSPFFATEHRRLWKEDAALMRDMGIKVYRLGLEWSRIEPEESRFDEEALMYYRRELMLLREYGISPLVTLHHFTNPLWFERMGGFEAPEAKRLFLRYVEMSVRALGDLASEYITINEPNVYAVNGYYYGAWPPGKRSFKSAVSVMSALVPCHTEAYLLIHRVRQEMGFDDTRVGYAHHMRVFAPKNPLNPAHRIGARLTERFFQGALHRAMCTGRAAFPLEDRGSPRGKFYDFHGLNYYTRSTVTGIGDGVRGGAAVNDLGWEIYPEGIVACAKKISARYPAPIYITENGTCDNEDRFRARFVFEHLKALCDSDLPVERYYHWCFCDNFEWLEGTCARFGLVHVDFDTQERTIKQSGRFYSEIIKAGGADEALYERFCRGEYNLSDAD